MILPLRFGVGIDPLDSPSEVLDYVKLAEDIGFSSAWIADSPVLWREAYVLLGAAAVNTSRISLGSGVTNPVTRDSSVIASAFSTLDELAPGRILMGIGSGDSAVRTIGRRPATNAEFEKSLRDLSRLLLGTAAGQPGLQLSFPRPVPILVSATGPRGLRLAARWGSGVILHFLTATLEAVESAKSIIASEAGLVGRDLNGFRFVGWIPCSIDDDGTRARQAVRVHVARHLLTASARPNDISPSLVAALEEGYRYSEHMHPQAKHAELVPTDLAGRFALAGTPSEVAEQLKRTLAAGLDELVIVPRGDFRVIARRFVEKVLPLI